MSVIGTGVFLSDEEVQELRGVQSVPFITGYDLVGPETTEHALYRIALAKGLPEIPGYYGLDQAKEPPEITRWQNDAVGEREQA